MHGALPPQVLRVEDADGGCDREFEMKAVAPASQSEHTPEHDAFVRPGVAP